MEIPEQDIDYVKMINRFDLSISFTKLCSRNCQLYRTDLTNHLLADKEKLCIQNCFKALNSTYEPFKEKIQDLLKGNKGDEASE